MKYEHQINWTNVYNNNLDADAVRLVWYRLIFHYPLFLWTYLGTDEKFDAVLCRTVKSNQRIRFLTNYKSTCLGFFHLFQAFFCWFFSCNWYTSFVSSLSSSRLCLLFVCVVFSLSVILKGAFLSIKTPLFINKLLFFLSIKWKVKTFPFIDKSLFFLSINTATLTKSFINFFSPKQFGGYLNINYNLSR